MCSHDANKGNDFTLLESYMFSVQSLMYQFLHGVMFNTL